jgi:hypothetical protein
MTMMMVVRLPWLEVWNEEAIRKHNFSFHLVYYKINSCFHKLIYLEEMIRLHSSVVAPVIHYPRPKIHRRMQFCNLQPYTHHIVCLSRKLLQLVAVQHGKRCRLGRRWHASTGR